MKVESDNYRMTAHYTNKVPNMQQMENDKMKQELAMANYHRLVQWLGRMGFVLGALLGLVYTLGGAYMIWNYWNEPLGMVTLVAIELSGIAFGGALVASIGVLERKRWALRLGKMAYIPLFWLLLTITTLSYMAFDEGYDMGFPEVYKILIALSAFPAFWGVIGAMLVLYHKLAPQYFQNGFKLEPMDWE